MTDHHCIKCDSTEDLTHQGGAIWLCASCEAALSSDPPEPPTPTDPEPDHDNPIDVSDVSDAERADMLEDFIDLFETNVGHRPLLMPLGDEGKEPIIRGMGKGVLDTERGRNQLVDAREAVRRIRDDGANGYCLYCDKDAHGTEGFVAVDVDDREDFPYDEFPDTASGLSGSGRGEHLYYESAGDVKRAFAKGQYDGTGEVKGTNWFIILPGSIHPSGGVYHVREEGHFATLADDDLPDEFRPSEHVVGDGSSYEEATDLSDIDDDVSDGITNDLGMTLEEIRDRDEKLDDLLTHLEPPGRPYPSASEADFAAASKLHFWRFTESQIARVLRRFRRRGKLVDRDDYLGLTVSKATQGEQFEPDDDDAEAVSLLPLPALDAMDHDDRVRFAEKRGVDWPTVDDVRDRLRSTLFDTIQAGETAPSIVRSPTGSGKTHTVAATDWLHYPDVTGEQPVIHVHKSTPARHQACMESDDAHGEYDELMGRTETCPVAAGHFDPDNSQGNRPMYIDGNPVSEWIDFQCDVLGMPYSVVHAWVEEKVDRQLPCEIDGECPSKHILDNVPRNEEGDPSSNVVHCTQPFLHVPGLRMHTNIVFDEKPDFSLDIPGDVVQQSIAAYLDYVNSPVDSIRDFTLACENGCEPEHTGKDHVEGVMIDEYREGFRERMGRRLDPDDGSVQCDECEGTGEVPDPEPESDTLGADDDESDTTDCPECGGDGYELRAPGQPSIGWFRDRTRVHALAGGFARAMWESEPVADGKRAATVPVNPPRFDRDAKRDDAWNRAWLTAVWDEDWNFVTAHLRPDFSLARSVVGLDAHVQEYDPHWGLNVGGDFQRERILTQQEESLYRRYERGLFVVQVGDAVHPVTSGNYLDGRQGEAFDTTIHHLRDRYDDDFRSAITSIQAKDHVRSSLRDAGADDPRLMHYGNEESRDDFAGENIGYLAGSIDPGDQPIMEMCAMLGVDAEPVTQECPACEGESATAGGGVESCGRCNSQGTVRERGRTFEGDDADMADAVLEGVREFHVAQGAGRWARDAADPDDTAIVFVHTSATPAGFVDTKVPGPEWIANDDQRDRLQYLADQAYGATAKEVAEAVGCSKKAAYRTLKTAAEKGLLDTHPGAGSHGATIYTPTPEFQQYGNVDLTVPSAETAPEDVYSTYTYSVSVSTALECVDPSAEGREEGRPVEVPLDPFREGVGPPGG